MSIASVSLRLRRLRLVLLNFDLFTMKHNVTAPATANANAAVVPELPKKYKTFSRILFLDMTIYFWPKKLHSFWSNSRFACDF